MSIRVKNNILNLAELQEKLDHTVFDHVDTTQNWGKAQEKLQPLYSEMTAYFKEAVNRNDGDMPKENSYWVLFMHTASRLVYFDNLVKHHISPAIDETSRRKIADGYVTAARILPHCQSEQNEEYFEEINKSLQQLTDGKMEVKKVQAPLSGCFQVFYEYIN